MNIENLFAGIAISGCKRIQVAVASGRFCDAKVSDIYLS